MKRKTMIILSTICLVALSLMITAFVVGATTKRTIIGFASMAVIIEKNYPTILELDLTLKNDRPVYKADVIINEKRAVVYFDAITGMEIERKEALLLDEEEISILSNYNILSSVNEAPLTGQTLSNIATQAQTGFSNNVQITYEKAKEIALAKVGGGTVRDIELDYENGILVYEVEIKYDGVEYDVDVEASTGEIVKYRSDHFINNSKNKIPSTEISNAVNSTPSQSNSTDSTTTLITYEKAKEIALARVGGGTVKEIELDHEKGKKIYETEIKYNGLEYEVNIDAITGEVVKYKIDD